MSSSEVSTTAPIGALWINLEPDKPGRLRGVVKIDGRKHPIVARYNPGKRNERQPDYLIYVREED